MVEDKYKHIGFTEGGKRVYKSNKKLYNKISGKYVNLPKNTKVISIDNYQATQVARGTEVSIRDSSSYAQFIYGRMRVGGTYTFLDTNQDSFAYLVSGSDDKALLFSAKTSGAAGNSITIQLISTGTVGAISVSVIGQAIAVTLKSSGGSPLSTRQQVIDAISATPAADALVKVNHAIKEGNGIVQPMSTTNLNYGGGNTLYAFITLACHQIDQIEKLYVDNREVTFGASPDPRWAVGSFQDRVFMAQFFGSDSETVQPDLNAQLPTKWTTDHRHRGMAGAARVSKYDQNTFVDGFPEEEFLVRGKPCYDPRTATTYWTQNAALIIADYLTNTKFGVGIPYADLDSATLIDSANCCDQDVTLAAGGTEKRYTINGRFHCGMTHRQVLEEMMLAMAGSLVYQGGKWFIYAGKWRSSSMSINEDDFRGALKISTKVSRRDNYNGVKGTYINPNDKYQEVEYSLVKNSSYITSDGSENFLDLNLNLVHSNAACQRVAKLMLERNRQSIELSAPFSARLLGLKVADTVEISFAKYGFVNKPFEVKDFIPRYDPQSGIGADITFRETSSSIYTDSMAEILYDVSPNTTLPSALTVTAPTELVLTSGSSELYLRQDGTVFSRLKVSWTAPNDIFVTSGGSYQVEYKKNSDPNWASLPLIPSNQTSLHILDVQDGVLYDVRLRALNSISVTSAWLTSASPHLVLGKGEKPNSVTGFAAAINNLSVALSWNANTELDIAGYRIKRSTGTDWFTATLVEDLVRSTKFEDNFRQAGTWNYLIRALDTSKNESSSNSQAIVVIQKPQQVASFSVRVTNNIILLDWQAPTSTTFPIAKYNIYKGETFETAILLGEAFVTFQAWTEQFAGSSNFFVTAVDTGNNESDPVSKLVNWFAPPDIIQYVYDSFDAENTELSSAILADGFANSFIAPVKVGDSWSQHFSRRGWDKFLDNMIGYDSDAIKAIPGLVAWYSANAEVTTIDGKVSQWNDLSGNGYHAVQGAATNRPLRTRSDNKENRLPYCTDLSNALGWNDSNTTRPSARIFYETTANAAHQIGSLYTPLFTEGTFICEFVARPQGSARWFRPVCEGASGGYVARVWFDCTGAGATDSPSGATNISITALTGDLAGYYRCKFTFTPTAANAVNSFLRVQAGGTGASPSASYIGVVTDGWEFEQISIRSSSADNEFIPTTNFPMIRGLNGNKTLFFNGSNNRLDAIFPNIPQPFTVFAVVKADFATALTFDRFIYNGLGGAGYQIGYYNTAGQLALFNGSNLLATRTAGNLEVLAFTSNTTSSTIHANGTSIASGTSGTTVDSMIGVAIGGDKTSLTSRAWLGRICELLIFNTALGTSDRQAVEAYLSKYTTGDYAQLEPFIQTSAGFIDEFTDRSWTTLQDKIDDGFTIWIEPADTDPAYFTRIVDTGSVIQGARIEASYTETLLHGSVTVECYLSTSKDLLTWTEHPEGKQVLANDFRFVRLQIEINGSDEMSLVRVGNPAISVGVREISLSGRATTKADGTLNVSVGSDFLSIKNIQLTPIGGVGREVYPIFDYGTLNPTSFDVVSFVSGSPALVDFNWTVIGATGEL